MTSSEDLEHRPTALVVVESMLGNTEQVGRAVAGGLADGGVDTVVLDVAAAPVDLPAQLDLVLMGAPTRVLPQPLAGTFHVSVVPSPQADSHERNARVVVLHAWWLYGPPSASGTRLSLLAVGTKDPVGPDSLL